MKGNILNNGVESESAVLLFKDVVRLRKSCRGFLGTPVSNEIINSVLEESQQSPSNCNTQPWNTHIVSGDALKEVSRILLKANASGNYSPDFSFSNDHFYGTYSDRQKAQGKAYYEGLGVAKGDVQGRRAVEELNYKFYHAPHAAFLFMPSFGDNVRVAADIGMYAQTFLLSLTAHGLAGIPQTGLGFFAEQVREVLNVSMDFKLLFGISFGYADPSAQGNSIKLGRDPISSNVTFHQ